MIRLRLLTICFVMAVECVFIMIGSLRVWEALSAKERVARYELDLDRLRDRYDDSLTRLKYVRSDRYVEDVARRDLGWSKEGETIFMVSEKATQK